MGKNKLARWSELATFERVIQPDISAVSQSDHQVKGKWNTLVFQNPNPVVLELGCGKGEYTTGLASRFPGMNFAGVDIKGARMWRGAKTANDHNLPNAAFLRTRIEFIESFFSADEADEIWVTFPDPHPGLKNAGKRLTSPCFLNRYRSFLKDNGIVHLKTDNSELYEYTRKVALANGLEILFSTSDLYSPSSGAGEIVFHYQAAGTNGRENTVFLKDILGIRTHYEKLFLSRGLKINYISFRLPKAKVIEYGFVKTKS
jgi:tRNA (guanine-N7-)-methyltransferase